MITSLTNQRVKDSAKLVTSSKERNERGLFVTEGEKLFNEAPFEVIESVFISESFAKAKGLSEGGWIDHKGGRMRFELLSDQVFKKISDTKTPQGILCVVKMKHFSLSGLLKDSERILMLEGIQDPGNLGTMLRTAEAAGYDCIIMDEGTADLYNPKVVRGTMGAIFRVKTAMTGDLKEAVLLAKSFGIKVYGAHLKGERDYDEESYADKAAILIGNEGRGLSDEISSLADCLIKIPMEGRAESLNAAVAAALIMYGSRKKGRGGPGRFLKRA